MKQNGWLSPLEIEEIQQIENWFENNLPDPPLYSETDSPKAITWFRRKTTIKMLEKIERIKTIIGKNGWKIEVVSCEMLRAKSSTKMNIKSPPSDERSTLKNTLYLE